MTFGALGGFLRTPKNPPGYGPDMGTIAQLCWAISSQLRHVSTIGKKLVKQQYVLHMSHDMVNFGLLAAEICWEFGAPLQISTGFASWQRYCTASSSGRQPNFAALNRWRPSRWAFAHISSLLLFSFPTSHFGMCVLQI